MNCSDVIEYYKKDKRTRFQNRLIGLVGELGAGKTHLVKGITKALYKDVANEVSSPTYTLCNIYNSETIEIHHYDLYRIESEDELYETGIMESIEKENALVFVEWIDLYPEIMGLCDDIIKIYIKEPQRDYILRHQ